ncbi:MAG: hypothetical protein AB1782_09320, partial [Cyanobacteriota bacterium]
QFAMTIKPEVMTREDLETLFVRFSREISVNFPEAWAQMHGILNTALPDAFVPDTSMDDTSRLAIDQFAMTIKPEVMTREDLETLFVRFSREISVNFPEAWAIMSNLLNNALPYAYEPDLTIDDDTKLVVQDFQSLLHNQEFSSKELNSIFTDYIRQIPLQHSKGISSLEKAMTNKFHEADIKDKQTRKMNEECNQVENKYKCISSEAKDIDLEAQQISKELKQSINKDDIYYGQQKLKSIQKDKKSLDASYSGLLWGLNNNIKANDNFTDDYVHEITISFDKKNREELFEINSKELTNWDMLRTLRRKEVLDVLYEVPQDELVEHLYVVPKHILQKALIGLPVEDMCRVLFNARYPEALLRAMPRKKAVELLPPPKEMLAVLMNLKEISGYKTGCDLIEDVVTKGLKVEKEQNPTRTQEEIIPFIEEQLIGKTPRNADALRPVQGKENPIQKALKIITENHGDYEDTVRQKTPGKEKQKFKYEKPESLKPNQLNQLALETASKFNKDELRETLGAKRGVPAQMLQFLECMKKVKDLPSAKMAVSVLSDNQAQLIAKATLPILRTNHLVKISQFYGKSSKDMVKQMPRYAIVGLIKALPKHFMIQGFKLLDKKMTIGMLKTRSSQTIARVASDLLPRDYVKELALNKKNKPCWQ